MKYGIIVATLAVAISASVVALEYKNVASSDFGRFLGSILFVDSSTTASLKLQHSRAQQGGQEKVNILIVPGHDDDWSGTAFKGMREADLNLQLGEALARFFKKEKNIAVVITRDQNGYRKEFSDYFVKERQKITAYRNAQRKLMQNAIDKNLVTHYVEVSHNAAIDEVGIRLYGINKWANEHNTHITLHIHFNDYSGRKYNTPGKYTGFVIYIPEKQLSNSKGSVALAQSVFARLSNGISVSSFPLEKKGIVEDQELIATGSNNSLDPAALLIEYGYIYEPQLINQELRDAFITEAAFQTYLAIKDFFGEKVSDKYQTTLLPYVWNKDYQKDDRSKDIMSMQMALLKEGTYPPGGMTTNECPISGIFGECTKKALIAFQENNNILPASGYFGETTQAKLNELYGQ
jgi:N-acetylmuramoyl-L-alanine amidase